jgi:hypothetical protein
MNHINDDSILLGTIVVLSHDQNTTCSSPPRSAKVAFDDHVRVNADAGL